MTERRRHIRVLVPGAYCELLVSGASVGFVPLEDVSDSGVFVGVLRPTIPLKTKVQLRFIEESPPLIIEGTIAQVTQPGGPRPPGYGIELIAPPIDAVERVAAARAPMMSAVAPIAPSASPTALPATDAYAAIILGRLGGHGPPMAQALSLFGTATHFSTDPKSTMAHLEKRTRVVLAELALLDVSTVAITHIRSAAAKARVIIAVEALPNVDVRAKLLRQGADELLLIPFDVFNVMRTIDAHCARPAGR